MAQAVRGILLTVADAVHRLVGRREDHLPYLDAVAVTVIATAQRQQDAASADVDMAQLAAAERYARAARVFLAIGASRQAWRQLYQAEMYLEAAFGVFP